MIGYIYIYTCTYVCIDGYDWICMYRCMYNVRYAHIDPPGAVVPFARNPFIKGAVSLQYFLSTFYRKVQEDHIRIYGGFHTWGYLKMDGL